MRPTFVKPTSSKGSSTAVPADSTAEVTLISAFIRGKVVRLGRSGFAVRTHRPPIVGESYPCLLHLGEAEANLAGRVRWCVLKKMEKGSGGDAVPTYHVGIEVEPEDRPAFHELLELLAASREAVN